MFVAPRDIRRFDHSAGSGSSNATKSIEISLHQGGDSPHSLSTFHPQFTYPIFGEEERIFGYKDLRVRLRFAAHDLYPNLEVNYDKKFKPVGDTKATDIGETFKEWLHEGRAVVLSMQYCNGLTPMLALEAFAKLSSFNARLKTDSTAADYRPPGNFIEGFNLKDRQFEIWCTKLKDPAAVLLISRMQIFISFFIEGGTPLLLDDAEWTMALWRVFLIYEKLPLGSDATATASPYSLAGYSTTYQFTTPVSSSLPTDPQALLSSSPEDPSFLKSLSLDPSSLPHRARISQFLILPPHQGLGLGSRLFQCMTNTFLSDPACYEITVEDPSEAFDDLRDFCDFRRLSENGTLNQIKMNSDIDPKLAAKKIGVRVPTSQLLDMPLLEKLRLKNKLAPRQFWRLVELYLLSTIPHPVRTSGTARLTQKARTKDPEDRKYYFWRLLVKQRIYRRNKDTLIQLERLERIEKVEEAVGEQAGDYERLLRAMALKEIEKSEVGEGGSSNGPAANRAKRKLIVEDDDEEGASDGSDIKKVKDR